MITYLRLLLYGSKDVCLTQHSLNSILYMYLGDAITKECGIQSLAKLSLLFF